MTTSPPFVTPGAGLSRQRGRPAEELYHRAVQRAAQPFQGVFDVVVRPELAAPAACDQLPGGVRRSLVRCVDGHLLPAWLQRPVGTGGVTQRGERRNECGQGVLADDTGGPVVEPVRVG